METHIWSRLSSETAAAANITSFFARRTFVMEKIYIVYKWMYSEFNKNYFKRVLFLSGKNKKFLAKSSRNYREYKIKF